MKRTVTLALILAVFCSMAQVTPYLKVTLDRKQLAGFCDLGQGTATPQETVYFHSGLGTTGQAQIWEHIVGHWGQADGVGLMTAEGNGVFSITFNLVDYYTNLASPDSTQSGGEGIGPMPNGATPYNIGCVFREAGPCPVDGQGNILCVEGKDTGCRDIYIVSLPNPDGNGFLQVLDESNGNNFGAVTAQYVGSVGINSISNTLSASAFPNPFTNRLQLDFTVAEEAVSVEVTDVTGRIITTLLRDETRSGKHHLTWNAAEVEAGVYLIRFNTASGTSVMKVVKQ